MKVEYLLVFGLIIIDAALFAGNDNLPVGARSSSLATASVSLADVWSSFNNQAGVAWLSTTSVGLHYENKFLVKEYALHAGVMAMRLKPGTGALSYRYFGYSKYHECKIGFAFARKLNKILSVGVQLNYHQLYLAEGYGNVNSLSAEIGVMIKPVENLFIGAHIFNPNRSKPSVAPEEYIPTIIRAGARYNILSKATLLFEVEKDLDRKQILKGGLEINALKNLDFRVGFGTDYIDYTFGIGYMLQRFAVDFAFSHHYILGFTPQASLTMNLGRK